MANNKSVLSQLQSVGEDAVARITKSTAARSALEKGNQLKDRAGKSLSGLEGIEDRLAKIEKRLSALEGTAKPASTRSRSTATKSTRSTTSKPRTTTENKTTS